MIFGRGIKGVLFFTQSQMILKGFFEIKKQKTKTNHHVFLLETKDYVVTKQHIKNNFKTKIS